MANKKYNFVADPCILSDIVLNSASYAVKDYNRTGSSILAISHRSSEFENVINEFQSLVRELLEVPDDYSILFLQGGASTRFSMVSMCLMQQHKRAAYLDTGYFSIKAIKEAMSLGPVRIAKIDYLSYYLPDNK
jgi:phosphoserine aminotransferase